MTDDDILMSHMFVRLSNIESDEFTVKRWLDGELGDHQDLLGFAKWHDNSWELVVHRQSVAKISAALKESFPSCHLQVDDDPLQLDQAEIDGLRYGIAMARVCYAFSKQMEEQQWPLARRFYELRYNQE